MAGRFTIQAVFKTVDNITAPIKKIGNRLSIMTSNASRDISNLDHSMSRMSGSMRQMFTVMTIGAVGLSAALGDVIKTGATFEHSIIEAAARFPSQPQIGSDAFTRLEHEARRVGRTTEAMSSQAAEGLKIFAIAGLTLEESILALNPIVDMATAGSLDLAEASSIAVNAMGGFNKLDISDSAEKIKELTRLNDLLVKTSISANTLLPDISQALQTGAPMAATYGADAETVLAMVRTLATAGIEGTKVGIALKRTFTSLSAPTSEGAAMLRYLKVATIDKGTGAPRDPIDIYEDLFKAMDGRANKMPLFEAIFGKIPIAAANKLTSSVESLRDFREELYRTGNVSNEIANYIRQSLQMRFTMLRSAIESVKISVFSLHNEHLNKLVDGWTAWVRANEKLLAQKIGNVLAFILRNIEAIVKTIAGIVALGAAFMSLALSIKSVAVVLEGIALFKTIKAMRATAIAAGGLSTSIVMMLGVVSLLIVAIVAVIYFWDDLYKTWKESALWVKLLFGPLTAIMVVAHLIIKYWRPVKEFFKNNIWGKLVSATKFLLAPLKDMVVLLKLMSKALYNLGTVAAVQVDWLMSFAKSIFKGWNPLFELFHDKPWKDKPLWLELIFRPGAGLIFLAKGIINSWKPVVDFFSIDGELRNPFSAFGASFLSEKMIRNMDGIIKSIKDLFKRTVEDSMMDFVILPEWVIAGWERLKQTIEGLVDVFSRMFAVFDKYELGTAGEMFGDFIADKLFGDNGDSENLAYAGGYQSKNDMIASNSERDRRITELKILVEAATGSSASVEKNGIPLTDAESTGGFHE